MKTFKKTFYWILIIFFRMGIPEEEVDGKVAKEDRRFRLEVIHIRGFDGRKTSSEDIYEYFKEFSPISFEWVDPNSANVIWALAQTAAKALLTLSKPITDDRKETEIVTDPTCGGAPVANKLDSLNDEDEDMVVDVRKADEGDALDNKSEDEEADQDEGNAFDSKEKDKFKEILLSKVSQICVYLRLEDPQKLLRKHFGLLNLANFFLLTFGFCSLRTVGRKKRFCCLNWESLSLRSPR